MPMTLTAAERWELVARKEAIESARLRLAMAEAQAQEAVNRMMTAYGLTGPCDIAEDGTITPHVPSPVPTASGRAPDGGMEAA